MKRDFKADYCKNHGICLLKPPEITFIRKTFYKKDLL